MLSKAKREAIEDAIRGKLFLTALILIQRAALDMRGHYAHRAALISTAQSCIERQGAALAVDAPRVCREQAAAAGGPVGELWTLFAAAAETLPIAEGPG